MLTWKDVLFSSDLVALLERSKTAERREKTAPVFHIRACFGLKHQLLITFYSAGPLHNSGSTYRNPNLQHSACTRTHVYAHTHTERCGDAGVRI